MASNRVRVGFIENRGPNTLLNLLKSELPRATDVRIAVAFVTFSGLEELLPALQGVASRGRVRILCGLYQRFTDPRALRTLLRLQQRSGGRFEVRLSKDVRFHQKTYIVGRKTTATIIVGSSNMTTDGLRSTGEFSIVLRRPRDSTTTKELVRIFENHWIPQNSVGLRENLIKKYEEGRPKGAQPRALNAGELRKILGSLPPISEREPIQTRNDVTPSEKHRHYWRYWIDGYLGKATEAILAGTTDWDSSGFTWCSTDRPNPFAISDRIFLFDFAGRRRFVSLVKVEDFTRTPVSTPDGRWFVAYKPLRRGRRFLTKKFWIEYESIGLKKKSVRRLRRLTAGTAERLKRLLSHGRT